MYCFPKLEPNYPVTIELEFEVSALPREENKEEKGDLKGKNLISLLTVTNFLAIIFKLN